ncbi:MAG: O-antigen ligase family protein [Nostoc sp. ChiSLP02]|nr:O-antigen ligase family protein [Nostoc sp. DedSLP05]MDZ8099412.1 O-antigen ligase family protein [Nostoc sp. DedSLP01]MDZ8184588.1 O-antigen ligase family protein [Nostoc sp. ChiSLP02]
MIIDIHKKTNFLTYYQCGLAVVAVLIFFTNLDVYWQTAGILSLEPLHWIILLIVASTPIIFLFPSREKFLPKSLLIWCFGYFVISLFYFWLFSSTPEAFQELRTRILSIIFLVLISLILSKYYLIQIFTRYAIILVGLLSTIVNIYEFFNPLTFSAVNETGRAAGFYINPNTSGCALVLSLIFGVDLLQPKYRIPFALIIGVGVFLTFSRGSLIGWIVVMIILTNANVTPRRQLFLWLVGLGIMIAFVGGITGNLFDLDSLQDMGLINDNVLGRLQEFGSPSTTDDDAALARIEVVKIAWQMFSEHPFIGNGIGSTRGLSVGGLSTHDISTHNMYLYFMTDHGIIGALIYPLLIYAVTCSYKAKNKYIIWGFVSFYLIWGFFSHNIVEQRFHLMTFSLMATMNQSNQRLNYQL